MALLTITAKGRITVSKKIRDQRKLRPGDKLNFQIEDDGSLRVYPIAKRVAEVFGCFSHKAVKARSRAGIKRGLRKAFREGPF